MKKLEELKAALAAATPVPPPAVIPETKRATDEVVEQLSVPFKMYETSYIYRDRFDPHPVLTGGCVDEITCTRFGISRGCSLPSINFKTARGDVCIGTVRDYYLTREDAQAEIDYWVAVSNQEEAWKELNDLMYEALPALIECAEAMLALGDAFDCGQRAGDTSAIGKYRKALAKLKESS